MISSRLGNNSNLDRPSSGVELLLLEKNKEATCKYITGNDGKGFDLRSRIALYSYFKKVIGCSCYVMLVMKIAS